jgi:hypothetical protein
LAFTALSSFRQDHAEHGERVFRKSLPLGLDPGQTGFAIRIRASSKQKAFFWWQTFAGKRFGINPLWLRISGLPHGRRPAE